MAQIDADEVRYPCIRSIVVFLGDYIDRGPDSRGTIELLIASTRMREVVCLKGNHETFVRRFLDASLSLNDWRLMGGFETLASYGLKPSLGLNDGEHERLAEELRVAMPAQHLAFLDSLPSSFICGDFFFVHAGVRPGIALDRQTEDDLLWIRDDFLHYGSPFEKFVVHGHTPVNAPEVRFNRVSIDTGAFATGRLSCVAIEGSDIVPLLDIRDWAADGDTRTESVQTKRDGGLDALLRQNRGLYVPQSAQRPDPSYPEATRPFRRKTASRIIAP